MQDWIIFIASTLIVTLVTSAMTAIAAWNPEVGGLVALVIGIMIMIFILPLAF